MEMVWLRRPLGRAPAALLSQGKLRRRHVGWHLAVGFRLPVSRHLKLHTFSRMHRPVALRQA